MSRSRRTGCPPSLMDPRVELAHVEAELAEHVATSSTPGSPDGVPVISRIAAADPTR